MIFALVYCTAGVSGRPHQPGRHVRPPPRRKLSLTRAVYYVVMQCLGAVCGAGVVKAFGSALYESAGRRRQRRQPRVHQGRRPRRRGRGHVRARVHRLLRHRRQAHRQGLPRPRAGPAAHRLRRIPGAPRHHPHHRHRHHPARSLGAAIIYDNPHGWHGHWIFWVGPFAGAALAAVYHQVVLRAIPFKSSAHY
ncbi:Aquaporin PIP1-6 [Zea mays]|uniref:Aquaporin PIP1-6 n=1 Tax=Zea mays TaxID=4577 RepID=A0A1D6I3X1_MAIZE|nr:Aquaporin PIP1-6 [Zea mays]